MSSNSPPDPARPGDLTADWKGPAPANTAAADGPLTDELLPTWDTNPPPPLAVPVAVPVEGAPLEAVPVAVPVEPTAETVPVAVPVPPCTALVAIAAPAEAAGTAVAEPAVEAPADVVEAAPPAPPPVLMCPICGSANPSRRPSCDDCGYYFTAAELASEGPAAPTAAAAAPAAPGQEVRVQDRYGLREKVSDHLGVARFAALDYGDGSQPPVPVVVVRQELPPAAPIAEEVAEPALSLEDASDEILPSFDEPVAAMSVTQVLPGRPAWPSITWERRLLRALEHPALPVELAYFTDEANEYLVLEAPAGRSLWDAWDDPQSTARDRFGWLGEIAEALHRLHQAGAMLEGLRPDIVVIGSDGHARLSDLSDLLPLPVPPDAPIRGRLSTAPELLSSPGQADARAELYSFGAMIYSLREGHELTEMDFERAGAGHPKPFIPRFPDVHPALGRLMMKTFRREVEARFPTDEASKEDASGFVELIRTLGVLQRTYDNVRLEIASWTTTGIVRTGNEDAYALLYSCESRQDDLGEAAVVLLCDGMGGYEAGEVAAALAIQVMRQTLVSQKPFSSVAGSSHFPTDVLTQMSRAEGHAGPPLDVEACKKQLKAALKEANKQVFAASRAPGTKRRGMGCTAEAVYVDGQNVVVGHVGDSRTYHLHEGRMIQLTRDQTLVNRLVELGTLTPEEAETHPRRNELQQAIGGQPDVEPGIYAGKLKPGDWVVVCSDGLSNHVNARDLQQMLQHEATSAEMAARRLVNLTNIEGATDNATVVVIRAT